MKRLISILAVGLAVVLPLQAAQTLLSVTNGGGGISLIKSSNAPVPSFKGLVAGAGVTITDGANVTIAASGGASAPTNTFDGNQFTLMGGTNVHFAVGARATNFNGQGSSASVFVGTNMAAGTGAAFGTIFGRDGSYWGANSVNLGVGNNVGEWGIGIGVLAYADKYGIAIGYQSGDGTNNGPQNISIGYQSTPSGSNSVAIGPGAPQAATDGVSLGRGATGGGKTNTVALGAGAVGTVVNQIMLGTSGHGVEIPGSLGVTGAITNRGLTPSTLMYANATKVESSVTLGAGLSLTAGTLAATGAGGTVGTLINTAATTAGQLVQFTDSTKTNTGPVTVGAGLLLSGGTLSVTNSTNNTQIAATNGFGTGVTLTNSTLWTSAIVDLAYGASNSVSSNLLVVTWNIATNNAALLVITNHCLLLLSGFPPTNQLWTGTLEINNASGYTLRTLGTNAWGTNGASTIDWLALMKTNGDNLMSFASSKRTNGQAKVVLQGF